MRRMVISSEPIRIPDLVAELTDRSCGAYVSFEGWVRDHNEGRVVEALEYEVYRPLAVKEGQKILAEAREKYPFERAVCAHREGALELGDVAVYVGVVSAHRDEAFRACRYIIDEIKLRLPIWKKEFYTDGDSGWVNCERCAEAHSHD